jgi:hypothetical protein
MTALTVEKDFAVTGGSFARLPSAASAVPFKGSILGWNSAGYARVLTAGDPFAGISRETILSAQSAASAGSRYIEAQTGEFFITGTVSGVAAVDIVKRRKVYASDDNALTFTAAGNTLIGRVVGLDGSLAIIACKTADRIHSDVYATVAAGTALTASQTETALDSFTIPAGRLAAGSVIRIRSQVIATATNSTDTLTVKLYYGGLAGTSIISTGALDVANSDVAYIDCSLIVRTQGASGTVIGAGLQTIGPPASATAKPFTLASSTIDTTAAQAITVSGTWSTTSASNSCRSDVLIVEVI